MAMTYHCLGLCAAKFGEYDEAAQHFATDLEIPRRGTGRRMVQSDIFNWST